MTDPLSSYPTMMSVKDLADFLGIGYTTARALMKQLPSVNVGISKNHSSLRIPKEFVRRKYYNEAIEQLPEANSSK